MLALGGVGGDAGGMLVRASYSKKAGGVYLVGARFFYAGDGGNRRLSCFACAGGGGVLAWSRR